VNKSLIFFFPLSFSIFVLISNSRFAAGLGLKAFVNTTPYLNARM
jgi:hypothetical protein